MAISILLATVVQVLSAIVAVLSFLRGDLAIGITWVIICLLWNMTRTNFVEEEKTKKKISEIESDLGGKE